ncbi:hypothetical protein BH20ACT17_BH20ACT17_05290 [soil metagenome]
MASEQQRPPPEPTEPLACAPCRGTGRVISKLGGEQASVHCPWCEGTGVQIPDHDAQAARRAAMAGP